MNDKLCDRCLACSHQILDTIEIETKFENFKDFKKVIQSILDLLDCRNNTLKQRIEQFKYDFLENICEECINSSKTVTRKFIELYLRSVLIIKMFDMILEGDYREDFFKHDWFKNIFRRKLLAIHFNKKDNNHMIRYYKVNLIKDDVGLVNTFECLNKINYYYKNIFNVPIYLANLDSEQYCERAKLNLNEKIKKHPLVLKS